MLEKTRRLLPAGLALALLTPAIAAGQQPGEDLASQIEELKKGQDEIREELKEIRTLLQQRQAPARPSGPDVAGKVMDLGDNPIKGASTASLTLVEFTDYQ